MYVLKDKELRTEIIWLHYNIPMAGHGGKWKMAELVTSIKIEEDGLDLFYFSFHFLFSF